MCGSGQVARVLAAALLALGASAAAAGELVWFAGGSPTPQAAAVAELLRSADEQGLRPADYGGPEWPARLAVAAAGDDAERARTDAALSADAARYLVHVHRGRARPLAPTELDLDDQTILAALRDLARGEDASRVVAALEPPFAGYRRALAALRRYRVLARAAAAQPAHEPLPSPRRPLVAGERYAGARRLAALLGQLGDLAPGAAVEDGSYGAALAEAVARFQRRHGLEPHGRLDAPTVARLEVPLARRVRQLELALERWRWAPRSFRSSPIVVNIPEYRLHAGDAGARWSTRVVVGRAYRTETPVFSGELTSVVFRPAWNVPRSIARNELAPEVARDPGYLARHGYQLVDRDGHEIAPSPDGAATAAQLRSGAVRARQVPGPRNALGLVKFVFPNAYDVYLHGTPASALFARSRRDLSHGCIRVEDPVRLAAWVLREEPGWTAARIAAAMGGPATTVVRLARSTPVVIVYGTAVVAEDGTVSFLDDVYGLDAALERALEAATSAHQRRTRPVSTWTKSAPG